MPITGLSYQIRPFGYGYNPITPPASTPPKNTDPYGNLPGSTPTNYVGNTPVTLDPTTGQWVPTSSLPPATNSPTAPPTTAPPTAPPTTTPPTTPPGGHLISGFNPNSGAPSSVTTPPGLTPPLTTPNTNMPTNLTGAPATGYDPAYGGVPVVPNPITTAGNSITGNLQNLPGILDLAKQLNAFNQDQLTGLYTGSIPDYLKNRGLQSQNITNNLLGLISPNDLPLYARSNAEYAGNRGLVGSPASAAALQRSLDLKSIDLQTLGGKQLNDLVTNTPVTKLFDPSSMFVTPDQQQQAQWMANLLASAGIPRDMINRALANLQAGLRQGKNLTSPQDLGLGNPTDPVADIIKKYGQTATGTPAAGAGPQGTYTGGNPYYFDPTTDTSYTTIPGLNDLFPEFSPTVTGGNDYFVDPTLGPSGAPNQPPPNLGAFDPNYDPFFFGGGEG